MERSTYRTRQRAAIWDAILSLGGQCFTPAQLEARLRLHGVSVGRATVYRALDRLVREGLLRKYALKDGGANYQATEADCAQKAHFHLRCSHCGRLYHLSCHYPEQLARHLQAEHGFRVDIARAVLYGHCRDCPEE